jgi:TPR repeat protein
MWNTNKKGKTRHKIQSLLFLLVSVLVFLTYVQIDREKNNNESAIPVAPESATRESFEKEIWRDRSIDHTQTKGGAFDRIKTKLKSVVLGKMVDRAETNVESFNRWLITIAEGDAAGTRADDLWDQTPDKNISEYIKCLPHGSLGEIPGDRLEIVYPVSRHETVSLSFDGGDLCNSHFNQSVIAKYILGAVYREGNFIPQNYSEALKWYLKASENGFPLAHHDLGTMYYYGYGVAQNYEIAARHFRKAADQGLSAAQDILGDMYYYGHYLKQNYAEALQWYRKAAEQGFSSAQNNMGIMYQYGYGVKADDAEAIKWYRKAADRNNAYAQYNLGDYYSESYPLRYDFKKAFKWYRRAAQNGYARAQRNLGVLYQMGRGAKQNHATAAKCYRAAAEQGNPEAMAHLGYLYEKGLGVGQNKTKAQDFYAATAQKADADTLFSIGVGWELDDCRPHDDAMAYLWYRLAAHKGIEQGNKNCDYLSKKMTAADISRAEELSRRLIERMGHGG